MKKLFSGIVLALLLAGMLMLAFNIQSVKASGTVGVKAGDWIKCTYTISGWPSGTPYPEWLKVEFLSVEGTNATVRVTMHMSDGTEQNATMPVDVVAGGGTFQGLSGFVIPANCTTGDSVYMSGYGNVTIAGEAIGSYAGATRTVVFASLSQYGTQLTYHWDKLTGAMVEASTISGDLTAAAKATETNMWQASGTIYIRADGSIDPPIAPISTVDNVTYTLTGNITSDADGMVVERDNIVVDGADYTIQGTGNGTGIALSDRNNVTIENVQIKAFFYSIYLYYSSNNSLSGNKITANSYGMMLIDSSNNTISGNSITENQNGIFLNNFSDNNTISKNNVTNSYNGIWLENHSGYNIISENNVTACLGYYGICISLSEYNSIYANNATNNKDGIYVYESHNNLLTFNIVRGNTESGIYLWNSGNNTLTNNKLTGNWLDFGVNAEYLSGFYQSIDSSNLIRGKPIYYLMDLENVTITPEDYPDIGCMALVNGNSVIIENLSFQGVQGLQLLYSRNCSVKNVNIENCTFAVWLLNSDKNSVSNVTVSNGYVGILHSSSTNNSVFENVIRGNEYGIWSFNSHGNRIRHNSFLNNSQQVRSEQSTNIWDDGYPSGGNYWSDYNGTDANHDGIGDIPYVIDANNTDHYPLVNQPIIPELSSFLILPLFMITTLSAVVVYRRRMEAES